MVSRLVLGSGGASRAVVEALAGRPGELAVVDDDDSWVQNLRNDGIRARLGDPSDRGLLEDYDPDVVFVGVGSPAGGLEAARSARDAFPSTHLVVSFGFGTDGGVQSNAAELADEVVSPGAALVGEVLDVVQSEGGIRARRLRQTLRAVGGPLAIVTHDNPDPDAIASAVALRELAAALGVEATACYFGEINHQENRALVNLLDLELRHLDAEAELDEFESIALVDHSRPGVNDELSPDRSIDLVIDHHPPRAPVEARFIDLRHDVGATSTLLVDYFERLGVTLDEYVATALLYGIRVDTMDFAREVSTEDFVAAASLLELADLSVLERVEDPSMSPDTLEVIGRAIRDSEVDGEVLVSYVGEIADRDALAQAAELLLDMDGVSTTMVFGRIEETVFISARARGTDLDLGETLRLSFDQIGSAGGHADMAGAQVPLKSISAMVFEDDRETVIRDSIAERFLETIMELPPTLTDRGRVGPRPEEYALVPYDGDED